MKITPLIKAIARYNNKSEGDAAIIPVLLHTGQHYDDRMSKVFFEELGIPKPDVDLGIGSASHAVQTAKIMMEFEKVCIDAKPDLVIVVGDVNSSLACSLVAVKLGIKVAHVEAGLRSLDRSMPEEINRIVTDSISDYLFTTCQEADDNLKKEGIPEDRIFFVGNTMVDTLLSHKDKSEKSFILDTLNLVDNGHIKQYALLTLHRPGNVDKRETFTRIMENIKEVSKHIPVIFPAHVRTQKQIEKFAMQDYFINKSDNSFLNEGIHLIEPLGYLDFLKLMSNAMMVCSDSGGIQEETTILGIPCLTLRENTERTITIEEGTNYLVGTSSDKVKGCVEDILRNKRKEGKIPPLWDGNAAERIVRILTDICL